MDFQECDNCPREAALTLLDGRKVCDDCYEAEMEPSWDEEW